MTTFLKPKLESIPDELKGYKQWVPWKGVARDNGKTDKIPYDAKTGKRAKSNDPQTWSDFDTAWKSYSHNGGGYDGIGFVLAKDDPFTGWDFDSCRDTQGRVTENIDSILSELNSYCEVSPSGSGLRVLTRGELPPADGKREMSRFTRTADF